MRRALQNLVKKSITASKQIDGNVNYNVQVKSYNSPLKSEVIYPYGYGASPPVGSMGLSFSVASQPENIATIPFNPKTRFLGLEEGEVIVGNQTQQISIKFLNSGDIEITTKGMCKITGDVLITGNLVVDGEITALNGTNPLSLSSFRATYNSHTHTDPQGGNTGAPNQPI